MEKAKSKEDQGVCGTLNDALDCIAHYALDGLTLKAAVLRLGFVTEDDFDCVVDPYYRCLPAARSQRGTKLTVPGFVTLVSECPLKRLASYLN